MGFKSKFKNFKGKAKLVIGTLVFALIGGTPFFYAGMTNEYTAIVEYRLEQNGLPLYVIGDTGTRHETKAKEFAGKQKNVAIVGDVFYGSGLEKKDDPKFITHFYKFFNKTENTYIMIGNHDVATRKSPQRIKRQASRYSNIHFPNHYYAFVYSDVCLMFLDTNVYRGSVAEKMWDFVDEFVKDEKCDGKPKIAMGHHPHKSSGQHGDAGGTRKRQYRKHIIGKFDMFIGGHDHNLSDEGEEDGTLLLVSGSGAKLRPCKGSRIYCESVNGLVKIDEAGIAEFITFKGSGVIDKDMHETNQQED